jgi:actin beta/gamma 1
LILIGGTTLLPGLDERLKKEVKYLAPVGTNVEVISSPEREFTVWTGGSILASLGSF